MILSMEYLTLTRVILVLFAVMFNPVTLLLGIRSYSLSLLFFFLFQFDHVLMGFCFDGRCRTLSVEQTDALESTWEGSTEGKTNDSTKHKILTSVKNSDTNHLQVSITPRIDKRMTIRKPDLSSEGFLTSFTICAKDRQSATETIEIDITSYIILEYSSEMTQTLSHSTGLALELAVPFPLSIWSDWS